MEFQLNFFVNKISNHLFKIISFEFNNLNAISKNKMIYLVFRSISLLRFYMFSYVTPLHIAVVDKNIEIIKVLLSHPNIDVNAVNEIFEF